VSLYAPKFMFKAEQASKVLCIIIPIIIWYTKKECISSLKKSVLFTN